MEGNQEYFRGKHVVVTGAASGIGLALTEELLSYGAAKAVLADFNEDGLDRQASRLSQAYPGRVLGVVCDVTKEDQVQNLISRAADFSDGRIDLLINNAGAGFGGCFVEPSTDSEITKILPVSSNQDWEKAFALNFYGALYGCRAVIPLMQAQGGGQIVNVISGIAFSPMAYQTRYAATKAALNALSLALRYEFWDDQIKVSSATPGTTATAIWGDLGAPESAQTAQQSAQRILTGVANNDRLILGDDGDVSGANYCFNSNPEAMAGNDTYLLDVARTRRSGRMVV